MALLGGIVGKILGLLLLVVVLLVATVVFLYSTDYAVEASVTDKNCSPSADKPPHVIVKTRLGGLVETVPVNQMECFVIQPGNWVQYHIRTERTIIYDRDPAMGGDCVYDTLNKVC